MQIFQQRLREWVGETKRVLMLDVHSGLGPWGKLQLMETRQSSNDQRRRLLTHFAEFSDAFDLERPLHYQTRGDFGSWCADQLTSVDFQYFCAEFGTYGPLRTLSALRSELQEWEWGGSQPDIDSSVRRRVREVFCPESSQWRKMVSAQTQSMLKCAFDYLRDSGEPTAQ